MSEKAFSIIDNYINKVFLSVDDIRGVMISVEKLDDFFNKSNIKVNPNLLFKLLKENNMLMKAIELIVNHYNTLIKSGKLKEVFKSERLVLLIQIYCDINDIEIKEEAEEEIDESLVSSDSVRMYLNDIQGRPLLTKKQEYELAVRISNGDKKAREIFIESNLRLVISIAKKYVDRGVDFLDLIQEGNIGLMKALEKFDVTMGFKFSTYAFYVITTEIKRGIVKHNRTIKIPVKVSEVLNNYKRVLNDLSISIGREPTVDEIASEMGKTCEEVRNLQKYSMQITSLDVPVSEEDEYSTLVDFIPSDEVVEDRIVDSSLAYQVEKMFSECNLKPREIEILKYRLGFYGYPMVFREIGKELGITYQGAQSAYNRAIKKLRMSRSIDNIKNYADIRSRVM